MSLLDTLITPLGRLLKNRRAGLQHSVRRAPELAAETAIDFGSNSFAPGATIPDRHAFTGRGPNVSPELHWGILPTGTKQLLLVVEDIDVPMAQPGLHLVALFPPTITGFAEGFLTADNPDVRYVPTRKGRIGYVGPRALPGHGQHHYGFHLYALDAVVGNSTAASSFADVLPLFAGHVLAGGFLEGTQTA